MAVVSSTGERIVDPRTGAVVAAAPLGDGPAMPDDQAPEVSIEVFEAVDFDGDGVDEIVEVELSRDAYTASRYAAIYRVHGDVLDRVGLWELQASNGTEGTGCNRTFS